MSPKSQSAPPDFQICPSCKQPIRFQKNSYCPHCSRYQSGKQPNPKGPQTMQTTDNVTFSWLLPWVKSKGMKAVKWSSLLIFIAFPLIALSENSNRLIWNSQQISQFIFAALAGYGFLILSLNKTRINITPDTLVVKRGPIPVPLVSSCRIKKTEVSRINLYKVPGYKRGPETFSLYIHTRNNRVRDVLSTENENDGIRFYEFIRTYWDIDDQVEPVEEKKYQAYKTSKRSKLSIIYNAGFLSALALNLPAVFFVNYWSFKYSFFLSFLVLTVFLFCLYYFHHRKHLNFWNSLPLAKDEKNPGAPAYFLISVVISLLLTPCLMVIANLLDKYSGNWH